jgi:U3 small nucleolar RNA-associated protein 23
MKLKRAKAYRKLMHQYELQFGFREAYQVLLDAEILQDCARFKIDLLPRLQGVLSGAVKPMITSVNCLD